MAAVEQQIQPALWGRIALLGSLLLVVLPHLLRMPVALSLLALATILWRILLEMRGWALPNRLLRVMVTLSGFVLVYWSYHSVIGREAGVALLTVMLCLKLIEMRTLRDAMLIIFIGYFLVASAFLFSQSILIGLYLIGVVLLLTTGLIVLNHPAANLASIKGHLKTAALMLTQGIPLMLLLFILFPRFDSPLWFMPDDKSSAKTGLSDSMTMGNITSLVDSEEVAFRVRFDGEIPEASRLYWRAMVLWQTDGKQWQRRNVSYKALAAPTRIEVSGTAEVSYHVTLEAHQQKWLPVLDRPAAYPQGVEGKLLLTPDYQFYVVKDLKKLTQFSISSLLDYRDTRLEDWAWEAGLQLPEGANPQTLKLARQWRSEGLSDLALVNRALAHFRDEPFWYSRQPPALGDNPVDQFLFESRKGFCEHYAASLVTLMRAAGIPARVVVGYQGGEVNPLGPLGKYLIIRQSDAHAWAEVWLEDRGWLRIDPTAMIPASRVEAIADSLRFESVEAPPIALEQIAWLVEGWRTLRNSWDAANNAWNFWVVGFDSNRQSRLLKQLGLDGFKLRNLGFVMLAATALLLLAVSLLLFYRRQRIDPVVVLYRRFCRRFKQIGISYHETETPQQFFDRVVAIRPELADEVGAITDIYYRLRYHPAATPELRRELQRRIGAFRL
jgi:transglutaminase-like putative cysteine protease